MPPDGPIVQRQQAFDAWRVPPTRVPAAYLALAQTWDTPVVDCATGMTMENIFDAPIAGFNTVSSQSVHPLLGVDARTR